MEKGEVLSASEKAEQRRQKILAKKQARMALVSGNGAGSEKAEDKRPEEEEESGIDTQNGDIIEEANKDNESSILSGQHGKGLQIRNTISSNASSSSHEIASTHFLERPFDPTLPISSLQQRTGPALGSTPSDSSETRSFKYSYARSATVLLFIILGMVFAVCNGTKFIVGWPISAIELFVYTRTILFALNRIMNHFQHGGSDRQTYNAPTTHGTSRSLFDTLETIYNSFTALSQLWVELSAYLFSFLVTWYLLPLTGLSDK